MVVMTISSSINSGSGRSTQKCLETTSKVTGNVTENMKKTANLRQSEPPVLEDNESHSGIIFSYVSLRKKRKP